MLAVSKPSRMLLAMLCTALLTLAIPTESALAKQGHSGKYTKLSHYVKHAKWSHRGKHNKRSKRGKFAKLLRQGRQNQHDMCQDLKGGTRGLYRLCLVYCEAQSCDADSAAAGLCTRQRFTERVLENYNRLRERAGNIDDTMPCLEEPGTKTATPSTPVSPCPCLTEQEATDTQWVSCFIDDGQTTASGAGGEELSIDTTSSSCGLTSLYYGAEDRYVEDLNSEQLSACSALIETAAENDGEGCQSSSGGAEYE